jgi:hypothetical protein
MRDASDAKQGRERGVMHVSVLGGNRAAGAPMVDPAHAQLEVQRAQVPDDNSVAGRIARGLEPIRPAPRASRAAELADVAFGMGPAPRDTSDVPF